MATGARDSGAAPWDVPKQALLLSPQGSVSAAPLPGGIILPSFFLLPLPLGVLFLPPPVTPARSASPPLTPLLPSESLYNYGSAGASPGFACRACFAVTGEGVATASCSRGSRVGSDGDFWIVRTRIYDDDRCGAFNSLSRRRPQDENSPSLVLYPFLAGLVKSLLLGALSSLQHLLLAKNVQLAASVFTPRK